MSLVIDNNTLVQILIRRGTDASRKTVILTQGELGYATDTNRLFIGDGITRGGNSIASKFLSNTSTLASISSNAQIGDFTFDPTLNNIYRYDSNGFTTAGPTFLYGTGFSQLSSNLTIQLDTNYWTASANTVIIGQRSNSGIPNTSYPNYKLNVNNSLSINGPTTQQLVLSAGTSQVVLSTTGSTTGNPGAASNYALLINGSTFVNGYLSAIAGSFANVFNNITAATTLSSDSFTYQTVPNLVIESYQRSTNLQTPIVNVSYGSGSILSPALVINAQPFFGVNCSTTVNTIFSALTATTNFAVSATNSVFTGSVLVNGDVISNFAASDISLKENIQPINQALTKILSLDGITFNWKDNFIYSGKSAGLLAQQVETILPEAVQTRSDGYKGVDYSKIIPILVEAIKELNNKIK